MGVSPGLLTIAEPGLQDLLHATGLRHEQRRTATFQVLTTEEAHPGADLPRDHFPGLLHPGQDHLRENKGGNIRRQDGATAQWEQHLYLHHDIEDGDQIRDRDRDVSEDRTESGLDRSTDQDHRHGRAAIGTQGGDSYHTLIHPRHNATTNKLTLSGLARATIGASAAARAVTEADRHAEEETRVRVVVAATAVAAEAAAIAAAEAVVEQTNSQGEDL